MTTKTNAPMCPKCRKNRLTIGTGRNRRDGLVAYPYRCNVCGTAGELVYRMTFVRATVGPGGVSKRIPAFRRAIAFGEDIAKSLGQSKKNFDDLDAADRKAKAARQIVGRYIREPYADGHAYYLITEDLGDEVRIEVCTGLGDDWVLPSWGEETLIEKNYAKESLRRRDAMDRFFHRDKKPA